MRAEGKLEIDKYSGKGLLIWLCLSLVALIFFSSRYLSEINPATKLQEGWDISINGNRDLGVDLESYGFDVTDKGDSVVMTKIMPTSYDRAALSVYSIHSIIDVFLDDELIYTYGRARYEKGRLIGYGFHIIELPEDYAGKMLTIKMDVTENDAFTKIHIPEIYEHDTFLKTLIRTNRVQLLLNIFLIVLGLLLALVAIPLVVFDKKLIVFVWTGLFSFMVGGWSFANYNFVSLFSDSLYLKVVMEYSTLYLAPLFLILYFKEILSKDGKYRGIILNIILLLQLIFIVVAFGGQLLNILHFPDVLKHSHLLMLATALYIVFALGYDVKHKKGLSDTLFWGAIIMLAVLGSDMFRFYLEKYFIISKDAVFNNYACVGILIFIVAMIINCIQLFMNGLYKRVETKMLEELAFTDAMTGLVNRRACDMKFDEIDERHLDYAVITFDLNNLKKINDTRGHDEGDRYIMSFSNALRNVFADFGTVGRFGGDEFVVIVSKCDCKIIEEKLSELDDELEIINKSNEGWGMSAAHGYTSSSLKEYTSVRDALDEADSKMYENKKAMKSRLRE